MKLNIRSKRSGSYVQWVNPLEPMLVDIESPGSSRASLTVSDAQNRIYAKQDISLKDGKTTAEFMSAGALGKQVVTVTAGSDTGTVDFVLMASTGIGSPDNFLDAFYNIIGLMIKMPPFHKAGDKLLRGIRWIRDHTHFLKGFKYWEKDIKPLVDLYLDNQAPNGQFFDYFVDEDGKVTYWRQDNEADLEYLLVEAVYSVWQATGDDEWMSSRLANLEKGLEYNFTDPKRWSAEHGLVKRPFTIDTWDFEYLEDGRSKSVDPSTIRKVCENGYDIRAVDERTKYCIMHGDNSGIYMACTLMARMYGHRNDTERTAYWSSRADEIRERTNKACWNGTFYTHQVHIDPVNIPVDESKQLSLSNSYDMNRGLPDHKMSVSILKEYQRRRRTSGSFAEWFSIDPPFPTGVFAEEAWAYEGEYINGAVMPLVAGELSRAAFEHGLEEYGYDIIKRFDDLVKRDGTIFFMYTREGKRWIYRQRPIDGGPPRWGSAALMHAFMEGLAGIVDKATRYTRVRISPRWAVTGSRDITVTARYPASDGYFSYRYRYNSRKKAITMQCAGSGDTAEYHVLLPKGKKVKSVTVSGKKTACKKNTVEKSVYADFTAPVSAPEITIHLQ